MATAFFDTKDTRALVDKARDTLLNITIPDRSKVDPLADVLLIINANAGKFDEHCQVNIRWIGSSITSMLSNLSRTQPVQDSDIDELYALLYRVVLEFDLSLANDLSSELQKFQQYAVENSTSFSPRARETITWALRQMPIAIMKHLLGTDALQNVHNVKKYAELVDEKIAAFSQDLDDRETRAGDLKKSLDQYRNGFNFVGLYQGFDDLSVVKSTEVTKLRGWLVVFGFLSITPLLVGMILFYLNIDRLAVVGWQLLIGAIPAVSLTVILIYFFRIALRASDSAKSQLLQLDLRKTLCRFIQSYADYAKSVGDSNPTSLAKFESVIFSGLVSSDEKLPTTFDGIEQLSNMIKAVRAA